MAGCPWLSVSALSSSSCPYLRTLDLRWAEGVRDGQIKDLVTPQGEAPLVILSVSTSAHVQALVEALKTHMCTIFTVTVLDNIDHTGVLP